MRLTAFSAMNYLNHRGLNVLIQPTTQVLLVAGPNGSGKTGIAQGIALALEGDPIRGLEYKNQLGDLITQGEKDGYVVVDAIVDGSPGVWKTSLKSGAHEGGALDGSALPLDPLRFFALSAADRRKALFHMAGVRLTPPEMRDALVKKGNTQERVDQITHHFRVGFGAAETKARELATEARGAWKATTGETHGDVKAQTWTAPIAVERRDDLKPVAELEIDVAGAQARADTAKATLDALNNAAEQWKRAEKATKAKGALAATTKELADLRTAYQRDSNELQELELSAQHAGGDQCACPGCGAVLYWNTKGTLQLWDKAKPAVSPPQAHTQLESKRASVKNLLAKIESTQQAVADGQAAQELIKALPRQPTDDEIKVAAAEKTKLAAKYHADVGAFVALADAIKNLPAEYLSSTLKTVNEYCALAASALDKSVVIGDDMEPRYGSIPYALASESQQWRIRMAVGYALAIMGKLDVMVLDSFDQIEPAGRGKILQWLSAQNQVQVVLCATLKAKPELAAPFQVVWLS